MVTHAQQHAGEQEEGPRSSSRYRRLVNEDEGAATSASSASAAGGHAAAAHLEPEHQEEKLNLNEDAEKHRNDKRDGTKRFFCWRLSKRKWLSAIAASVVALLLTVFLVVWFPVLSAVFQHHTDNVDVTLNYFDIVKVDTAPNARTLGMKLSLRFKHDLPTNAKTKATKVQLMFAGSEFAALDLPVLDLKSGEQEYDLVLSGDTLVTDADAFAALSRTVITQQTLMIDTRAKISAHASGISRSVDFKRSLAFKGLNNFASPPAEINRMTVRSCSTSGLNIAINASIDNVANLGLGGIGALNLSLYYDQGYLGYAVTANPELGIPRGNSTQLFNVTIDSASAQTGVIGRMVLGITTGSAQFYLTGDNAHATQVDLLKEPLKALNVSILYQDMLSKVAFDPQCDLLTLLGLA